MASLEDISGNEIEFTVSPQLLSDKNSHKRDKMIRFKEQGHSYFINGKKSSYRSVTTLVHQHFSKFNADEVITNMMKSKNWESSKYHGMTRAEIKKQWNDNGKESARLGTKMHQMFEYYYNGINLDNIERDYGDTIEYQYFMNFVNEHQDLIPYRTEWAVFSEKFKVTGSIDMIFENEDGTLSIYDWKRCKSIDRYNSFGKCCKIKKLSNIDDCNYFHYSFQLNIYKKILETHYDKRIKDMYLVVIHPNNETNNYIKIPVPEMDREATIMLNEPYLSF